MPNQPTPVYEWYRFEDLQTTSQQNVGVLYNPPFFPGPAGRLLPYMTNGPILRGFLKRSEIAGRTPANDPGARGRLYFMFNPTSLAQAWQFDQSAYLSAQASEADRQVNLGGQTAFNFALFFERSIEVAHNPDHSGVLVDVDILNYIVRGVPSNLIGRTANVGVPGGYIDPVDTSVPAEPSGVFIGQAQLIDAVFSKYMTIRGNVTSLQIDYVKFSHRMVPVMASVNIGMTVTAQTVGTQGIPSTANQSDTTNAGGAGAGDPGNRYGNAGGTG
jgi:hypothetical protein